MMAANSQIFVGMTIPSMLAASSSSSSTGLSMVRRPLTTSFYNAGVGALKLETIRVAPSNKQNHYKHRGTALVARMNLFDRFAMVIKSYANAIMSSFEDPEKMLEQAVLEMKDDLAKMRQASAQAMASRKMLENKYEAAKRASEDWYRKAQLAVQQREEDLAREALKRRISLADNASSLRSQLDQQKGAFDSLVSNTKILESKIHEAMSKKDTLKARARSAKVASEVGEMVGNVDTGSALSAFGMMEEKVLAMEALGQLTMDDVEGKFAVLESSSSVEDDLAKLMKQLSAGRSKKGELPPGRTAAASNKAYLLNDSVIEMGLSELRLKAKVDCL